MVKVAKIGWGSTKKQAGGSTSLNFMHTVVCKCMQLQKCVIINCVHIMMSLHSILLLQSFDSCMLPPTV